MKKLIAFTVIVLIAQIGYGQNLSLRTYVESTNVSSKMGTAIGFENDLGFEYGGFYQESTLMDNLIKKETTTRPRLYEKEFFGLYGAAAIVQKASYDLKLQVRMGVVNREHFSITPSILANYHLFKSVSIGGGIGTRAFQLTYQGSITIRL